ncbi:trehalose operon repressor [Weissella halotolerans]|uniref:Trehalose operon repressor n=1 Tax=Weissella halotolerans DSM 20190 TaxID=1123500 RepID=A0A0R2G9Y4_9LACO|nr:trehalose operon repressor [Weissella halotolerans]KRN33501.1 transcriptional regulator [Weissella halotolerans DSM 20190]
MEKYRIIYQELKERLNQGAYQAGQLLPSDQQLMRQYTVARETVRKAMALLANEGYVQRLRGKGTIAINRRQFHFPVAEIMSYTELTQAEHLDSQNHVLSLSQSYIPVVFHPSDPQALAHRLVRLRIVEGEADIIDYDYVLTATVPELPLAEAKNSLFHYFEQGLGLTIDYAVKTLTVEQATDADRKYMQLPVHTPMVVVRSQTYLNDSQTLSYTESRHRADRFLSVEFARRH